MERKSLTSLRDEMRAVARGDCRAPPRPEATTLFGILTPDVFELINVLATTPTEILSGMPVFAGTRVPIDTVLACIDAEEDWERMRESYPIADDEHIAAARAYRAVHPQGRMLSLIERHPDLVLASQGVF